MKKSPSSTIRRLLDLLRPMRGVVLLSLACRVANQSLAILLIVLAVAGIAQIARDPSTAVMPIAAALVVTAMVKGIVRYLEQFSGHFVAFRLLADLRHLFYSHLERLSPAGLPGARSGDLVSRAIADIDRIEVFYAHTIAPAAVAVIVPSVVLVAIAAYSPIIAIALGPWLLLVGGFVPWLGHRASKAPAATARRALAQLAAHFTDTIQGVREVLVFGAESERTRIRASIEQRADRAQQCLAKAGALQNALTELAIGAAILTALGLGAIAVRTGTLDVFDLPVVFSLALAAFLPLLGVANLAPDLEQAMRSAERLFAIFDIPTPRCPHHRGRGATPTGGGIAFDNVTFRYPGRTARSLAHLSFRAAPGEITALRGPSGAGKSTVLQLLLGFRATGAGRVFIAGQDIANLRGEKIRETVTVVPQQIHLFNGSVRENLLLARPGASMPEIENAAQRAHIHDFIVSLPQGYDTPLQELGAAFSGGQRQRLALARAFLRAAPVLLLDEASAHLDATTERHLFTSLRRWLTEDPRRTVLLVSHRPVWIDLADRVVTLSAGACVH